MKRNENIDEIKNEFKKGGCGMSIRKIVTLILALLPTFIFASTYYIDSAVGQDSNAGTSPNEAWKTLDKVNTFNFHPGDKILFKRALVWQGQLAPRSSGAEVAPIIIDCYGEGKRPCIDAAGKFEDAVRLYNVQQIEVRNLEITNQGEKPVLLRRGVHIFLNNFGVAKHIVIAGLYIHHINSTNQRKNTGGIVFTTQGDTIPSRFEDLTIEYNIIWKADRSGIVAQSYHAQRTRWNPSTKVVIRDNYVADIGGDGIVPWATDGAIIEHNIAYRCNQRGENYNAGIWPWSTDNTIIQLNEASYTRATRDGEGFDSDFNSRNSLFQYNYSHDNEGGFILICGPGERDTKNNIGNSGTEVRYNISHNDHTRLLNINGGVTHTLVHNNAFYVGPGINVDVLVGTWNGWPEDLVFKNNTFYSEGNVHYGHQVTWDRQEGIYEIGTGWGPAKGVVFDGNRFYGIHLDRPIDAKAILKKDVKPRVSDWNVPVFNPSNPDGFEEFMSRHRTWILKQMEKEFGKPVKLER